MADASSVLGSVSLFAALMAGISVAVERVVEIIKGAVPRLAKAWPKNDEIRGGILQLIAAAAGTVISSRMPTQVKSAMPAALNADIGWQVYIVLGLLASGGSGVWNHLLDILGAFKSKQESSVKSESVVKTETSAALTVAVKETAKATAAGGV